MRSSFKKTLFVALGFFLLSCAKNEEELPSHVLSTEEMSEIISRMALAESAASLNIRMVPLANMDSVYSFDILKEVGVTKSHYDTSLQFYASNPKLYAEVYNLALEKISLMEARRGSADSAHPPK